jgi:hypothetical protein
MPSLQDALHCAIRAGAIPRPPSKAERRAARLRLLMWLSSKWDEPYTNNHGTAAEDTGEIVRSLNRYAPVT